jgi:hypothetical protein
MHKKLMIVLALTGVTALGVTAIASAKFDVFRAGNLVLRADGGVSPKKLPRRSYAPVQVRIRGKIATSDGTHPSAFREAEIDFDRNGKLNTRGLPACRGGQLEARNTSAAKRVCGKSIVGSGNGGIQISFPEQRPITVKAPITVFNGGSKGNKTTLYIHTFITVPVPSAVVTTVTIKKVRKGRYGLNTVSKVPVIAGGSGSVLDFDIRFKRNFRYRGRKQAYFVARCTDGKFSAKILKALFRNEANEPGAAARTTLKGTVIRPCTPKGR